VVRADYRYSTYGERTKVGGDLDSDWGYAGLFHHGPSGLDLATYRTYDSKMGRWISRDPLGEGVDYNLYRYCGNNPINCVDPLGNTALNVNILAPTEGAYEGGPFKGMPTVKVAGQITNYNEGTILPFWPSSDRFRKVKVRIALKGKKKGSCIEEILGHRDYYFEVLEGVDNHNFELEISGAKASLYETIWSDITVNGIGPNSWTLETKNGKYAGNSPQEFTVQHATSPQAPPSQNFPPPEDY
jgi:RHS repeat-associated protein